MTDYENFAALVAAGRASFARDSVAFWDGDGTLVEYAADAPRLADGVGLILEPGGSNDLTNSNDFSAGSYGGYFKKPDDLAKNAVGPDGEEDSAWSFSLQYVNGSGEANRAGLVSVGGTQDTTRTASVWLRADSALAVRFGVNDEAGSEITIGTTWQRYSRTGLVASNIRIWQLVAFSDGVNSAVPGEAKIYLAFAQSELTSEASSYIAASGSAETRAADELVLHLPAGTHDLTVTFDDLSEQVFAGISGDHAVDVAVLDRPVVRGMSVKVSQ